MKRLMSEAWRSSPMTPVGRQDTHGLGSPNHKTGRGVLLVRIRRVRLGWRKIDDFFFLVLVATLEGPKWRKKKR